MTDSTTENVQYELTAEGRAHVLPLMRELRASMGRDLTSDEVLAWLDGWLCAEKYAAHCAITDTEFKWLRAMVVRPVRESAATNE